MQLKNCRAARLPLVGVHIRHAVPREVHPTKITHIAIRIDAVRAYSSSRIPGPIVGMGWDRSHNIL